MVLNVDDPEEFLGELNAAHDNMFGLVNLEAMNVLKKYDVMNGKLFGLPLSNIKRLIDEDRQRRAR